MINVLFIGDVNGRPGRNACRAILPNLIRDKAVDFIIANGENSAGGFGITKEVFDEFMDMRVNCVTTGNHVWDKKEVMLFIENEKRLLKPANLSPATPGHPYGVYTVSKGGKEVKVGVMCLVGRVFMTPADDPFRAADAAATAIHNQTPVIIVDIHAEATSEKAALAHYLDGKVSAVIGTHTHVQTSDERLLTNGLAYMTDAGMTGAFDSVIGMRKEIIIKKFLTGIAEKFEVATGDVHFNAALVAIDEQTGRAKQIERLDIRHDGRS